VSKGFFISVFILIAFQLTACRKYAHIKKETVYSEFKHQGFDRSYLVHTPLNYDSTKSYPLIFVLHGITSRAKAIAGFSRFNEMADKKEFIVCYPQGYKRSWGIPVEVGPAPKAGINDLTFFDRLIDTLCINYAIDSARIFSCGISNGGFMSATLACNMPEQIAGIALVCSNMFAPPDEYYPADKPMPVLMIAGRDDPILPYNGGPFGESYRFLGFESTVDYWCEKNSYPNLVDTVIIDNDTRDKTYVVRRYNADSDNPNKVEIYDIEGGGHAWPGRGKDWKTFIFGKISNEIDATEIIADFFLSQ